MLAFPLLELGQMEEAEKAGKRGLEICKDDPWSQHAVSLSCLFNMSTPNLQIKILF